MEAGADLLGFVCDENSPRRVDPDAFCEIAARLPSHIQKIGVFDRTTDYYWRLAGGDLLRLFSQIQYYQDSLWTDIIRENGEMGRKIKAFHMASDKDLRRVGQFNGLVQSYLLNVNAPAPLGYQGADAYGWELARETHQFGKRIYLAGGLTPENVAGAIARVRPYAVDVTVGVESAPGVKDHAKMRDFIQAAHSL